MMKRFLLVVSIISFVSCSNNADESPLNEPTEIKMSSDVLNTRAPILSDEDGNIVDLNSLPVFFARCADAATADWNTVGITNPTDGVSPGILSAALSNNGDVTFSTTQYYCRSATNAHFLGFAPSGNYDKQASSPVTVTWNITGKEDLLFTTQDVSGNMNSNKSTALTPTFDHLLTWLTFHIIAEDDGARTIWGKVKSITIKDQKSEVKLALTPSANPTFEGTLVNFVTTIGPDDHDPGEQELPIIPNEPLHYSQALVETASTYTIEIDTEEHSDYEVQVNLGPDIKRGKHSEVTLTFRTADISVKAKVSEWEDGPDDFIDIE